MKKISIQMALALFFLAACANPVVTPESDDFERVLGIPVEPQLKIGALRDQVNPYESITLGITNDSAVPIIFPDVNLGVRAFKFNPQTNNWSPAELTPKVNNPKPFVLEPAPAPGQGPRVTFLTVPNQWRKDTGTIRFVIVGSTNPSDLEGSKVASYVDVFISSENPTFFGNWQQQDDLHIAEPDQMTYAAFSFEGYDATVTVQEGPTSGAIKLEIEGSRAQTYRNYSEIISLRTIKIQADSMAPKIIRLYPTQDSECNNGHGNTGVGEFKAE